MPVGLLGAFIISSSSMFTLLDYFLRMIRLRARPQDLPASQALLAILVMLAVFIGTINSIEFLGGLQAAMLLNMLDAVVTVALLWITLQISARTSRFIQTASAFFGVSGLLVLVIFFVNQVMVAVGQPVLGAVLLLLVSTWSQVVYGHILRHALEVRLFTGILISLGYSVVSFIIISRFITTV